MKRFGIITAIWAASVIALLATACTPAANIARGLVERADGASLTYLTDGLGFDSGASAAKSVILIVAFDELTSFTAPEGATCEVEELILDCRLGDVEGRAVLLLSAKNVNASATFRREAGNSVYQVFAY